MKKKSKNPPEMKLNKVERVRMGNRKRERKRVRERRKRDQAEERLKKG